MPGSTAAINTGGKKHSLQGRNKAEQNCRRTQDAPHIKKKRSDKIGTLLLGECAVLFAPHTPQIKRKPPDKLEGFLFMPVVGVEPTRVISTRDFEFWGGFSIWCHLVPTAQRQNSRLDEQ